MTGTSAYADTLPSAMRATKMVYTGILFNSGHNGTEIDPAFMNQSVAGMEQTTRQVMKKQKNWHFVQKGQQFWGQDATKGNIVFVALVVSRARVTTTRYKKLDMYRHTAWLTLSLEFFNVQTRTIYYSALRTGYKVLTNSKPLQDSVRLSLLNHAAIEMIPRLIKEASKRFDPDFVTGFVHAVRGYKRKFTMDLNRSVGIGPGQYFFFWIKDEKGHKNSKQPGRLQVTGVDGHLLHLQAGAGMKIPDNTQVFTIANKSDPPGIISFSVAPVRLTDQAGLLTGSESFLRSLLHGLLANKGNIRMISPIEVVWNKRVLDLFRRMAIISTSEVELHMHRSLPMYEIKSVVAQLSNRITRKTALEQEKAYISIVASRIYRIQWGYDSVEPKITGLTKATKLIFGKGLNLVTILPGKETEDRDQYMISVQDAMDDLAEKISDVVIGRKLKETP